MEISPLSDWLNPRLGKIATSGDVIRGRYNARLVSRQILLVADKQQQQQQQQQYFI